MVCCSRGRGKEKEKKKGVLSSFLALCRGKGKKERGGRGPTDCRSRTSVPRWEGRKRKGGSTIFVEVTKPRYCVEGGQEGKKKKKKRREKVNDITYPFSNFTYACPRNGKEKGGRKILFYREWGEERENLLLLAAQFRNRRKGGNKRKGGGKGAKILPLP